MIASWVEAWRVWRLMKLSCKLGYHFQHKRLGDQCYCQTRQEVLPVWSADADY